jgi:carbonic anhydrase
MVKERTNGREACALASLLAGNARFVAGRSLRHDYAVERRRSLLPGWKPMAAILSCADSRVPPEIVFDQGLGSLYAVRAAGNVVDAVGLGSIEFAADALGVPLIVVLGHGGCRAMRVALAKGRPRGSIGAILRRLSGAAGMARSIGGHGKGDHLLDLAVRLNVGMVAAGLVARSPILRRLAGRGRVRIVKAVYDLNSGRVEVLA